MKWLAAVNVPASTASAAALKFTDEAQTGRTAGQLFERGKTILIITPDGAAVRNVFFDATLADATDRSVCAITLDMNKVVERVAAILKNEKVK